MKDQAFGTFCVSQSIIRIEPDRLIEVADRLAKVFEIATLEMEMALEVRVMRFYTIRRSSFGRPIIRSKQGSLQ